MSDFDEVIRKELDGAEQALKDVLQERDKLDERRADLTARAQELRRVVSRYRRALGLPARAAADCD